MKISRSLTSNLKKLLLKKVFVFMILLVIFSDTTCSFTLDNIKGCTTKDIMDPDLTIKDVKVELTDKEIRFFSSDAANFSSTLGNFLEAIKDPKFSAIHYDMLEKCEVDVEDNKDNSPIVISLKNPFDSKQYYLQLNFLSTEPNAKLPRSDIVKKISEKCSPVKDTLKQTFNALKTSLEKSISQVNSKKEKKRKEDNESSTTAEQESPETVNSDKERLKKLVQERDSITTKKGELSGDSQNQNKDKMDEKEKMAVNDKKTKELKQQLIDLEKKMKDIEKQKNVLTKKIPDDDKKKKDDLAKTNEAIAQKKRDKENKDNESSAAQDEIKNASQTALKHQLQKENSEKLADSAKKEADNVDVDGTKNEAKKHENDAHIKSTKCKAIDDKLKKYNEELKKKKNEVTELKKQLDEFKISPGTINASHHEVKKKLKEDTIKILSDLDKCFTFRLGFINQCKLTFYKDSKDAINYMMSFQPNPNRFNMVDKLYTATTTNVCGQYKTQLKKFRKKENKKLRETEKINKEAEKRKQNKTGELPEIFNSQEVGRKKFMLEYADSASSEQNKEIGQTM